VRKAMYDVARFWFKRGAYGFRLDAVGAMFEDPALPDNPVLPGTNKFGDPNTEFKYNSGLPELHEVLKELRQVSDEFPDNRVLIGETFTKTVAELSKMYGDNDELQLPMNFFFAYINKRSAPEFRKQIALWDKNPAGGWPVYLLSNHDTPRHYVRYGDGKNNDAIAKLMATMVLTLRGTPILYYGEEIGMTNNDPTRVEDVQDPIGKIGWPKEKGRDGERTPMHWNAGKHAGFTTGDKPWLPVAPNYTTHNVESEEKDPNSILSTYKNVIALRRTHPALLDGSYEPMNEKDPHLLSYLRKSENGTVLVVLNMANRKRNAKFDFSAFSPQCEGSSTGKVLFSTFGTPPGTSIDLNRVEVPAYGALIIEV